MAISNTALNIGSVSPNPAMVAKWMDTVVTLIVRLAPLHTFIPACFISVLLEVTLYKAAVIFRCPKQCHINKHAGTSHALGVDLAREPTFSNWNQYKCKLLEKLPPTLHGNLHYTTHMVTAQSYPSYERSAQTLLISKFFFYITDQLQELRRGANPTHMCLWWDGSCPWLKN